MVKNIIICDRCKKQLGSEEKAGRIAVKRNIAVYDSQFAKADFCMECIDEIVEFIRYGKEPVSRGKDGQTETIPETVCQDRNADGKNGSGTTVKDTGKSKKKMQEPEELQKQPRRKTDYGKILALSDAGWSNAKIADEMRMTPQQVSNAKYVAKKKLEDGTLVLGSGDGIDFMGGD